MEPVIVFEVCGTRLAAVIVDDIVVVAPEIVETIACDGVSGEVASRDVIIELTADESVAEESTI